MRLGMNESNRGSRESCSGHGGRGREGYIKYVKAGVEMGLESELELKQHKRRECLGLAGGMGRSGDKREGSTASNETTRIVGGSYEYP